MACANNQEISGLTKNDAMKKTKLLSPGFDSIEFADNPETRCPCVLLLDTSGSMEGEKIAALNTGLHAFKQSLEEDSLAASRVELSVITFGPVHVAQDWVVAANYRPERLHAQHATPMGQAILQAIEHVEERKAVYRDHGIGHYRPWIFMITDGEPTDDIKEAALAIQAGEESKRFAFFAVGVDGAKMDLLDELSSRKALKLRGLQFYEMFNWLSSSLQSFSRSHSGKITLSNPASPSGWATID